MDFVDYTNPIRYQPDYPLILFKTIKYLLLIILFSSMILLVILICLFLANQETWIQSASSQLDSSSVTINSGQIVNNNHNTINRSTPTPTSTLPPVTSLIPIGQSDYRETSLIDLKLELFQIKLSLALIYTVVGFISILSDDFNSTLFFTFASLIGFLFSLVRKDNQIQLELMIYTVITLILSFLYCLLLRINVKSKSSYYYGYLAS